MKSKRVKFLMQVESQQPIKVLRVYSWIISNGLITDAMLMLALTNAEANAVTEAKRVNIINGNLHFLALT